MKTFQNESKRIKELMNLSSINEGPELDVFPIDGDFNIGYDKEMSLSNPKHNSDFSRTRTDERHPQHIGVDIFGKKGSPVVAPVSGKIKTQENDTSGKVVIVQDKDGYCHFMGHLDTIMVEDGVVVFAGDKVGTVGNTGNAISTSPHVHYNVYKCDSGFDSGEDPFKNLEKAKHKLPSDVSEPNDKEVVDLLSIKGLSSLKDKLEDYFTSDDENKDVKNLEDDENKGIISLLVKKGEDFLKNVIDSF
jgi:murein DD-endopeptidase MepM/ murein hydrolase activator NlpD